MRIGADVMEPDDALWVNQYITAELPPVLTGFAWHAPAKNQLEVIPDRADSVNVPPTATCHSITGV